MARRLMEKWARTKYKKKIEKNIISPMFKRAGTLSEMKIRNNYKFAFKLLNFSGFCAYLYLPWSCF